MPTRDVDTALRIVHDLTQSVWLGGAAMGVVSIDAAASAGADPAAQVRGADRAWRRWHRISTPAIAAHLLSGVGLTVANRGRLVTQAGGARTTALRAALTGAALASEVSARKLGAAIAEHQPGTSDAAGPAGARDQTADALRRRLAVAQWSTVLTTAAMVAVGARMSEQQRPRELLRGLASRLRLAA